jgi:putative ATP-dependent endonuclease of the OLD family
LNPKDLKDAIKSVGSVDGTSLVASIEFAIEQQSTEALKPIWEYIKLRRRKLRTNILPEERSVLEQFIQGKKAENLFILSQGGLESYLPVGFAGKDLDKLIRFLSEDSFYNSLSPVARSELESIASDISRI